MVMEPIAGGMAGAVAGDGAADAPLPRDVTRVLSYLAHLLDERIGLRVGLDGEEFASLHLGVAGGEMVTTTAQLSGLGFQLAALAFARDLTDHPPVALVGETPSDAPRYEIFEFGAERRRIPYEVTAAFAAGSLAAVPLVVALEPEDWRDTSVLKVYSRTGDADAARAWLSTGCWSGATATTPSGAGPSKRSWPGRAGCASGCWTSSPSTGAISSCRRRCGPRSTATSTASSPPSTGWPPPGWPRTAACCCPGRRGRARRSSPGCWPPSSPPG